MFLEVDAVKKWIRNYGRTNEATLISEHNEELQEVVFNDMIRRGTNQGLMPYEQVKKIAFIAEPFTVENDLLTPTLKSRRHAVETKYRHLFEELYEQLQH